MPGGVPLGDSNSTDHTRHAGPPGRDPAHEVGMEQERLHDLRFPLAKRPGQSAHDPQEIRGLSRPETLDFHAGCLECGNQRCLARQRGWRQAVNDGRETVSVEPGGQFDQAALGSADIQVRNAQCNARHGPIPLPRLGAGAYTLWK